MKIKAIKTKRFESPQDDLLEVIKGAVDAIQEKSILVVTSKVLSISEGMCVKKKDISDLDELIIAEADKYIPRSCVPGGLVIHTIKDNLFIPSSGIDASNGGEYFVLWPKDAYSSAQRLHTWLRKTYNVKDVGVIVTDSHTIPMRRGTMGISIAHAGFRPTNDYRGKPDLFGREMKITLIDIADGLAAASVVAMGEGDESTPLALITDLPSVEFGDFTHLDDSPDTSFEIPEEEDLYFPLLSKIPWKKGGHGEL